MNQFIYVSNEINKIPNFSQDFNNFLELIMMTKKHKKSTKFSFLEEPVKHSNSGANTDTRIAKPRRIMTDQI